jgi:hypothetical protein
LCDFIRRAYGAPQKNITSSNLPPLFFFGGNNLDKGEKKGHPGGCPRMPFFPKSRNARKNYRRHMVDIPKIIFRA